MTRILLVFPHQLYSRHPGLEVHPNHILLIEDSLFFGDARYPACFHKQKLWLHRASMKRFEEVLVKKGHPVSYHPYEADTDCLYRAMRQVVDHVTSRAEIEFVTVDPTDFILEKRIRRFASKLGASCRLLPNPNFLNTPQQNQEYRSQKNRWFMADFYKFQRRRLGILMVDDEPVGGHWSFDKKNRKKVPQKMLEVIPQIACRKPDTIETKARQYVLERFPQNPGSLGRLWYPTSHRAASAWLTRFLEQRFRLFGDYEDAIVSRESWMWHSVLTPMLNVGLLAPDQIVERTLEYTECHDVPLNSVEGFFRQIIGWREFMRATYEDLGVEMRTTNYWQHNRKMPTSFYKGTTGILPVDDTIQRVLETGYCHHIERLMVLGGFMFLCEIDPQHIYRWFMELFVDSYDWVMVPNAYAMSQNADGGLITTKPYFSGSSYIRKMSHYKKADWCDVWDGLYWRWVWNHADDLAKNPRWAMMCSMVRKMDSEKLGLHLANAEGFLADLR